MWGDRTEETSAASVLSRTRSTLPGEDSEQEDSQEDNDIEPPYLIAETIAETMRFSPDSEYLAPCDQRPQPNSSLRLSAGRGLVF